MAVPVAGPFFLALVDEDETTFGPEHERMDLYVFSAQRTLAEGEKPTLELEIENPHVGLIGTGRKVCAWFSYQMGTEVVPLFFGRIVGAPVQLFAEVLVIRFIADPPKYKQLVQRVAEGMKVLPYWDPVFVDPGKRDDPDTILEGYASLWDVHETTHEVTAVSIIEGPDGNIDLDYHMYDNMDMAIAQPPATAILMDASVSWTQQSRGVVDLGGHNVVTYGGDGLMGDWPKPLAQLGNGWSVYYADSTDANDVAGSASVTISYSWSNREKHHENGDTMSVSFSQTLPMGVVGETGILTESSVTGVVDPYAVDSDGDPSPLNVPASFNQTSANVMLSNIKTTLSLEYVAARQRTERVVFTVRADTQPVLVDPDISQQSETITLSGADVGAPILNLLNWSAIAGLPVALGQVIFPDDSQIPGGRTAQIAVVAGTAGTDPPEFSDIPGFTTVDGGVTWSSLGSATPPDNANDWQALSHVNAGTVILPKKPAYYLSYALFVLPGTRMFPPKEVSVSEGTIVRASNGSFQVCTLGGLTSLTEPAFSSTWGSTVTSLTSQWRSLGTRLPSGTSYQICTTAGTTGARYVIPPFSETLHAPTTDGSAVWKCIGLGDVPIGGAPGSVIASSYFTTNRGRQSLEYLGLVVRAKLLYRARCVEVSFDVSYEDGIEFTARKTATLHDPRIFGGLALGKVRSAVLAVSDSGAAICRVTTACLVGKDNAVEEVDGDPEYCDDDYCDHDYQVHDGHLILLPTGTDLNYAPPVATVTDDGLVFPLTRSQVVLVDSVKGSYTAQGVGIRAALASMAAAARIPVGTSFDAEFARQKQIQLLNANSVPRAIALNPVYIEYQLRPVNAGPFHAVYNVKFSHLTMARGVDLESETTT